MEFKDWLLQQLADLGLNNSEFARKAGVSQARVSQILSGEPPGKKFLKRAATVLGKPEIEMFYVAGVISSRPKNYNPTHEEMMNLFASLSEEDQEEMLQLARVKLERKTKRGKK